MTRFDAKIVALLAFAFAAAACNQGEFTGSGAKKASGDGKKQDASPTTDKGDKGPSDLGNPDKEEDGGPNDNSDDSKGKEGDNVNDLLNGLIGDDGAEDTGTAVSPDEVVFGGNKVFHIGDSVMQNGSCTGEVGILSTAGARYYFEFQVKEPDTTVTINVNRICGVDYGDSNVFAVAHSGSYLQEQKLTKGSTSATMTTGSLQPGRYAIAIESRADSQERLAENPKNAGTVDRDDYLVGEVRIKGSKPITPGKAGAK